MSAWSALEMCTVSCGAGTQRRSREIVAEPSEFGLNCPDLEEYEPCYLPACASGEQSKEVLGGQARGAGRSGSGCREVRLRVP